jgi:hypothetical protein
MITPIHANSHMAGSRPWDEAIARPWREEPLTERLARCREFLVAHGVMVPYESRAVASRIYVRLENLMLDRDEYPDRGDDEP